MSDANHKYLKTRQAKLISDGETASFSRVLNETIVDSIKKHR